MKIIEAKGILRIEDIWTMMKLPGNPGTSCRAPHREDRTPSFSVFDNGRRFKDFATGEGGDQIDFLAMVLAITKKEACRKFLEMTRMLGCSGSRDFDTQPMDQGSDSEINLLANARQLPVPQGVGLLIQRELLGFTNHRHRKELYRAWAITDATRKNTQVRRMDFQEWPGVGKAKTLKGSKAAWPIGCSDLSLREIVLLVEGGPDLLAAATAAWVECGASEKMEHIGFACMTGATMKIPEEALPLFQGKRVRIFQHNDGAGRKAVDRWVNQLLTVTESRIDVWQSDVEGEDLNDYVSQYRLDGDGTPVWNEKLIPIQ